MAGTTLEKSLCPEPLVDASKVGKDGGYLSGRVCFSVLGSNNELDCCLPCPTTDWIYSASFRQQYKAAESLCVVGALLCLLLLLSWLLLPKKESRRDYLNMCLVVGIFSLALGFVLPLATKPDECFDTITPNDMSSSAVCAWSGAFIIFGGLAAGTWAFLRSLSLHLLLCWDFRVGRLFFIVAQGIGWSVVVILSGITLGVTGVSFRFGDVCHVNTSGSVPSFWGPLIVVSGSSALLQIVTFAFGLNLYILKQARLSEDYHESNSARMKQVWNLVRLQWRAIVVVTLILIDVLFFCFVFLRIDSNEKHVRTHPEKAHAWLACLTSHLEDNDACLVHAQDLLIDQNTAAALLFLLAISGIQCFLVFIQQPIVYAWVKLARSTLRCKQPPESYAEFGSELHSPEVSRARYVSFRPARPIEVQTPVKRSMVVDVESGKAEQAAVGEAGRVANLDN